MIVRTLDGIDGGESDVRAQTWRSRRFLLRQDQMGFSLHDTVIYAGTETRMWYKNHFEAVYCVGGEGEVETLADHRVYPVRPGTMYALDRHDEHILRAKTDLHLVCVFNPPCTGREVHDADGAYPLLDDLASRSGG